MPEKKKAFQDVEPRVSFPELEERILRFWKQQAIYDKSLARRKQAPRFVFYEGPPTANGMPHPGHCLTRAIKDLFPRYRTMRGYLCERKAGWDTHGLPVEVEVCKELGIHSKAEIEAYGVERFIHRCLESVFRYTREWEYLTERIGFWIHLEEAYVTYHQSYVESIWWCLKTLFDRGLLYHGHKIVWWWPQGGTALSAGEVGQGYRTVDDPSVYVRMPVLDEDGNETDTDLLIWTTTPWTLPSNQFVAVDPELEYARVWDAELGRHLVVARVLVEPLAEKFGRQWEVKETFPGRKLVGRRYRPPFDFYYREQGSRRGRLREGGEEYQGWRVVEADFVTTDSGTGLVHQAPAFGEVDFDVLRREQQRFLPGEEPPLLCAVAPDGTFTEEAPPYQGQFVKEADRQIMADLKQRGLLFHRETYQHEYPFCWRAEQDPLIQYPRKSWFIRTSQLKELMLENNRRIGWLPEHIRDGRFGNFLESNVDWALSRERFWGTPLPIWQCEATGRFEAVGSYQELLAKPGVQGTEVWEQAKRQNPDLPEHLKVHKPYIDAVTYDSPFEPGARMRRVSEVIDVWFDSGAMPFAQWGYPHQGHEQFREQFPADFISEAIDQTRGWFYSLLAISTMLFGTEPQPGERGTFRKEFPHPYRNCVVLGLMLGEDGHKMSKQRRNYREPREIFDRYGADAMRWYFFANQAPWTSIRYSEQAIRDSIPEFLLRLWNVYNFFVTYANIDGFDPGARIAGPAENLSPEVLAGGEGYRPHSQRGELDRWILSELDRTAQQVVEHMDRYENYPAARALHQFVDALSNWYVRRSRSRFWASGLEQDKLDAYWTLYECLVSTCKLVAPFVPFLAEELWQNLARSPFGDRVLESVHLCDYPTGEPSRYDEELSRRMGLVREIVSLGRSARTAQKLKVRQPLPQVEIVLADRRDQPWLEQHAELIAEELNVKQVHFAAQADQYIQYTVLPNLPRLGPRLGKRIPLLRKALAEADPAELLRRLESQGQVELPLEDGPLTLTRDDLQVRLQAKEGWAAAQGAGAVVVLNTQLTPELVQEGLARDLVRAIQEERRRRQCQYTDRIRLVIYTADEALQQAARAFAQYIQGETLAVQLQVQPQEPPEDDQVGRYKLGSATVGVQLEVVSGSRSPA